MTNWKKAALKSKNFDSFKVYIIKCYNENEKFYKIGRTFCTIKKRFQGKICMPYNYEIIKVFENNAEEMYKLENKLKKSNKKNKYVPKIIFKGMQECFEQLKNNINN